MGSIDHSLTDELAKTGLPVIAIILTIPAFIFDILSLSIGKEKIIFLSYLFNLFASIFGLASGIYGLFIAASFVAPVIVVTVCAYMLIISVIILIRICQKEKNEY